MKLTVNKLLGALGLAGLYLLFAAAAAGAQPVKVLILPFTIHAEKDLTYLREGIEDMLSTRLAIEGKTVLMDPDLAEEGLGSLTDLDQLTVMALGQSLGADYVVYGSLTVIFENISTDAHFVDIGQQKTIVTFNRTGKSLGDIIALEWPVTGSKRLSVTNSVVERPKRVNSISKDGQKKSPMGIDGIASATVAPGVRRSREERPWSSKVSRREIEVSRTSAFEYAEKRPRLALWVKARSRG